MSFALFGFLVAKEMLYTIFLYLRSIYTFLIFNCSAFFNTLFIYLFIWLCQVLVAARRIFIAGCRIFIMACGIF